MPLRSLKDAHAPHVSQRSRDVTSGVSPVGDGAAVAMHASGYSHRRHRRGNGAHEGTARRDRGLPPAGLVASAQAGRDAKGHHVARLAHHHDLRPYRHQVDILDKERENTWMISDKTSHKK